MDLPTAIRPALLLALLLLAGLGQAAPITSSQPLFVVVDGRWYVADTPLTPDGDPAGPLVIHPRGAQGFFLHGFFTARNCRRSGGSPLTTAPLLRHDETLDAPAAAGLPLRSETLLPGGASGPRIRLAFCPAATVVVVLRTSDGDAVCEGAVPPPWTGGCAGVTAALAETESVARIFRAGFESP